MLFDFGSRLGKVEAMVRARLAAAAAEASLREGAVEAGLMEARLSEAHPVGTAELANEEALRVDARALPTVDCHVNRPAKVPKNEEYRRLCAQYRGLPLVELLRLYAQLKCHQLERAVQRRRTVDEMGDAERVQRQKSFEECVRHARDYRESERWQQDNACNRGW